MARLLIIILFLMISTWSEAQTINILPSSTSESLLISYYDSLYKNISEADKLTYFTQLKDYGLEHNREDLEAAGYLYIGRTFYDQTKYPEGLLALQSGLESASKYNLSFIEAEIHLSLGGLYSYLNKKDLTYSHFTSAYKLFYPDYAYETAATLFNLANLNFSIGNYEDAIDYGHKSKAIFETLNYDSMVRLSKSNYMSLLNTIGISFREIGQYDSALHYLNSSYKIAEDINHAFWKNLINGNKGAIYFYKKEYDKALTYINLDLKTSIEFEEWGSAANAMNSLIQTYIALNDLEKAESLLDSVSTLITTHNLSDSQLDFLSNGSKLYERKGNFEKAYQWQQRYIIKKDSLNEIQKLLELSKIKATYDFDSQLSEIELLKKNNEIQENAIEKKNLFIIATTIILILIVGISLALYRNLRIKKKANEVLEKQKSVIAHQNEELASQGEQLSETNKKIQQVNENLEHKVAERTERLNEINKELDTFLYRASHDVRQPISTILGLENLARMRTDDEEMKNILQQLYTTASGMDKMLSKLQMLYLINHDNTNPSEVNLPELIAEILSSYHEEINYLNITFECSLSVNQIQIKAKLFEIILRNLIENAIHFSQKEQSNKIIISANQTLNDLKISVKDNGMGIDENYIDLIFKAFFKGSEHSRGNGLGLFLAKKAAITLGVDISVRSTYGQGSEFTITIPK